jgi:hypothetical protein
MLTTGSVLAEQGISHETYQYKLDWVETIDRYGFVGHMPAVDPQQLAENIETLHDDLVQNQQHLALKVEETRLNAGDAVITVIMPGGLLYAGYRKREHTRAVDDLAAVSGVIEELKGDLAASRRLASAVAYLD